MGAIRAKDTKPERVGRKPVWQLGLRCRLNVRSLPGCPDLVFRARRKVIMVHGCFWHRHSCSEGQSMPVSRVAYWSQKFARNKARDRKNRQTLVRLGWQVLVVWECQTAPKRLPRLAQRIQNFLERRDT